MLRGVKDLDANHRQRSTVGLISPSLSPPVAFLSESLRLPGLTSVGKLSVVSSFFEKRLQSGAVFDELCILAAYTADPYKLTFWYVGFHMFGMVGKLNPAKVSS